MTVTVNKYKTRIIQPVFIDAIITSLLTNVVLVSADIWPFFLLQPSPLSGTLPRLGN